MEVKIQSKDGYKVVNLNRRRAARERCLNCSAWSVKEVAECTFDDCPLFPFRSGRGKQNAKARSKAILSYCRWCCANQQDEISNCPASDCPLWPYRKGRIDRTPEIVSMPEKGHIEAFFDAI